MYYSFNIEAVLKLVENDNILKAIYNRALFQLKNNDSESVCMYIYTKFIEEDKFFSYEYGKIYNSIVNNKVALTA